MGECVGETTPSGMGNARAFVMWRGDDGCGILTGDSCLRGDAVPGKMMLRRCRCLELAARRKSPNSEIGDSVLGTRDMIEDDRTLASLSAPASLSK